MIISKTNNNNKNKPTPPQQQNNQNLPKWAKQKCQPNPNRWQMTLIQNWEAITMK